MKKSVVAMTGISLLVLGLAAQVALAAKAKVVDLSGTRWDVVMTMQFAVKKVDKEKMSGFTTLFIGPNGAEGIEAGEFKFGDLVGTYTDPKSNGNLVMQLDIADLEQGMNDVQEMLEGRFSTVEDFSCQITKLKMAAKIKLVTGGQLMFDMKFDVQAVVDGEPWKSTGTLSVKGKVCDL